VAPQCLPNFARFGAVAGAGARQNFSNKKNALSFFLFFICVFKFFLFFRNQQKKHLQAEKLKKNKKHKKTKKSKKLRKNQLQNKLLFLLLQKMLWVKHKGIWGVASKTARQMHAKK